MVFPGSVRPLNIDSRRRLAKGWGNRHRKAVIFLRLASIGLKLR
jgi:hypothetical protein